MNELATVSNVENLLTKANFRSWVKPTFSPEHGVLIVWSDTPGIPDINLTASCFIDDAFENISKTSKFEVVSKQLLKHAWLGVRIIFCFSFIMLWAGHS